MAPGAADNVTRIEAVLSRMREMGLSPEWKRPVLPGGEHVLSWDEGGKRREYTRTHLGWLAKWAEKRWPA